MKKIFFLIILFWVIPFSVSANDYVNVYVFHNYNCKYCHKALDYFHDLEKKDTSIHLFDYELLEDYHAFNRTIYNKVTTLLKIEERSVPLIIIGNNYIIGFSPSIEEKIQEYLSYYKENDYQDIVGYNIGIIDENNQLIEKQHHKDYHINTFFGKIKLNNLSLPLITIISGLIDGLNIYLILGIIILIVFINKKKIHDYLILSISFLGWYVFIYFIKLMAWININDYFNDLLFIKLLTIIPLIIISLISLYQYLKKKPSKDNYHHLSLSITNILFLSTLFSLLNIMNNNYISTQYIEILNSTQLIDNHYINYLLLYLLFFILIHLITLIIIKLFINKKQFIKIKKYFLLIKSIILFIISTIILFIKYN